MRLDDYQREAIRTAAMPAPGKPVIDNHHYSLAVFALGLTGEAGEVADLIKKHVGHGHALDSDKLCAELGDVLWYLAALADMCGFSLSTVATANIDKLRRRYPDGFTCERSIGREVPP